MPQIPERADVRDNERDAELILRTYLAEVDAPIFDGDAAASPVVTELHDLVLQRLVVEVVADTRDEIKTLAGFASVADQRANLARKRLLEERKHRRRLERKIAEGRVVVQPEEGSRDEEFPIGPYFQERANGHKSLNLRIVLKNLLQVVRAARSDPKIADDRRPVAGSEGKGERRDGVQRREDVALPVDDGAAKCGIKVVLLHDAPGNQFLRLAVAVFPEEPLCKAIFDFAGVGKSGIGVEPDKVCEVIYPGDVTVSKSGFDGVFVPAPHLVLLQRSAIEESFKRGRAEFHREFSGVAVDGNRSDQTGGIEGITVAINKIGSLNVLIAAVNHAGKAVEAEINGSVAPRRLFDGTETRFRQVA